MHIPFNPAIPFLKMPLRAVLTQASKDARTRLCSIGFICKKTGNSLNVHQALSTAMNMCSAFLTGIPAAKVLCFSNLKKKCFLFNGLVYCFLNKSLSNFSASIVVFINPSYQRCYDTI